MEDQEAAPADGVAAPPFSELIREWLDEGDRLDEKATATLAAAPVDSRFRRIVLRLRPALDRYRLFVLAGLGLIPFALFTLTHHVPSVPALAVSTVSNVPLPPVTLPPAALAPAPQAVPAPVRIAPPSARPVLSSPVVVAPAPGHRSNHHPKRRRTLRRAR